MSDDDCHDSIDIFSLALVNAANEVRAALVGGAELDATGLALVHASLLLAREATIQLEAVLADEAGGRRAM